MTDALQEFDWQMLLLGEEKWSFLFEVAGRTVAMFLIILLGLRLLGKRGVKQLSVFELGVIIGLGSAAGDPMFYKDVGLLPGIVVFCMVLSSYRLVTYLINRSRKFEEFVEGTPTCIVKNGKLVMSAFEAEPIAADELFSQLRNKSVSHLGQVEQAILETNGEVSVFYFAEEEVIYGLPILPDMLCEKLPVIPTQGQYACTHCAHVAQLPPGPAHPCPTCEKPGEWVEAINRKRIK